MKLRFKRKLLLLRKWLIELISITVGSFLISFGTAFFLLPNQLSSGGFSGIATIFYYLFKFPMGTGILLLNIPLFLIAFFKLGKKFFVKAIIGTGLLSIFLNYFNEVGAITDDRLLACIYGGIVIGIGTAIILKANASTGGSELLGNILSRYNPTMRTGSMIIIIDAIVVAINTIFFKEIEVALYSAIAIYFSGQMIDLIFEGTHFAKMIFIVSNKHEEIAKNIGNEIRRGSTGIYSKGMYNNENRVMLWCVASRREIVKIKQIALKIDNKSFIVITNAREVFGKGFK